MGRFDIEKVRDIYELFGDEESKDIYWSRVKYSITQDEKWLDEAINYCIKHVIDNVDTSFLEMISEKINGRRVALYGAGVHAKLWCGFLGKLTTRIDIVAKAHTGKARDDVNNIEEVINEYGSSICYIVTPVDIAVREEMKKYLLQKGVSPVAIIDVRINMQDIYPPYFDKDIVDLENEKCFLQAGCYDGKTIFDYALNCKSWSRIIAFEPDPINRSRCLEIFKGEEIKSVDILQLGLGNEKKQLKFASTGSSARASENGDIVIDVDSVDNVLGREEYKGEIPTYITLDIEGAEMDALEGMVKTIKKCRPKLAISVYHKPEDIFTIPRFIHDIVPEYKFYLRHYTGCENDTVLFAIL